MPDAAGQSIDVTSRLAIGVDIGGTKVAAGVVDGTGRVLARALRPTPSTDPVAVEDIVVELVTGLTAVATGPVVAVGVGAAGFVDPTGGTVVFAPHLAWRDEPLRQALRMRIPVPVTVENDANAAAWAEYRFGAARGATRAVCVTLGTGIGGGIVLDGRLERGAHGLAGEFGHMVCVPDGHRCECGGRGCWEQYASGNALGREGRELARAGSSLAHDLVVMAGGDPDAVTGAVVTSAAAAGDPAARELIEDVGRWLGHGLVGLIAALDPDVVVVGGGLCDAGDLLLDPARAVVHRTLPGRGFRREPPLSVAHLGPDAGLIGAADLAALAVV